jgi:hypothetical protein
MALSLDDLKKKKKPSTGGSIVASNPTNGATTTVVARKKLSPWDSINGNSSGDSTAAIALKTENNEKATIALTGNLCERGTEIHSLEIKPEFVCEVKTQLDASDCPISSDPPTLNGTILFSKNEDIEFKNFGSDTDLTQKAHRSDTEVTQNNLLCNVNSGNFINSNLIEKRHRSDTNNKSDTNIDSLGSDTEVTQESLPSRIKVRDVTTSDTEVTQNIQSTLIQGSRRSDTEVTQKQNSCVVANKEHAETFLNVYKAEMTQRTDTEVTQLKKTSKSVSLHPKQVTQPRHSTDTEVTPYLTQKRHKEVTQYSAVLDAELSAKKILLLKGNQLSVFNYCCFTLLNLGENILKVSYESLASQTSVNIGSIKTTLKRLRESNLISIESHGGGKGAFIYVKVEDSVLKVYARSMNPRSDTEVTHFTDKKGHRSDTIPDTKAPSKLVSNINNNLLTKEIESTAFNEPKIEVGLINIQSVAKFGISRKQIQDIFNQKLDFTTHTLQDFVDRFFIYASDPKNLRNVNSIPAIFVKMAQLASKGQDPLMDIETEADYAIRERIERLKAIQDARLKQETELVNLEYETWYATLTIQQMDAAAPPTLASKSGSSMQKIILKNYFLENVWPEKRALIFNLGKTMPSDFSNLLD